MQQQQQNSLPADRSRASGGGGSNLTYLTRYIMVGNGSLQKLGDHLKYIHMIQEDY